MLYWKLGTLIADDAKQVMSYVSLVPPWNAVNTDDAEEDEVEIHQHTKESTTETESEQVILTRYKQELDSLEQQKLALHGEDEEYRKHNQVIATDKHVLLESNVQGQITILLKAQEELLSHWKYIKAASTSVSTNSKEIKDYESDVKSWIGPKVRRLAFPNTTTRSFN